MVHYIFLDLIHVFFTKMMLPALAVNFRNTFNYSFHHSNFCCVISASDLPEIRLSVKPANSITNEVNHSQQNPIKNVSLRINRGASILHYKVVAYRELQQPYFLCSSSNQFLNTNESFMQFCGTYPSVSLW